MDQILPANSIAEVEAQSPAPQSTAPRIAVGLLILCVLGEAALLRLGIDDLDEGYFVQQAVRVLHGQIPYRDFETLYSPGLVYAHAGLLFAFGGDARAGLLLAPRALSLLARGALALLLYVVARPLVRHPGRDPAESAPRNRPQKECCQGPKKQGGTTDNNDHIIARTVVHLQDLIEHHGWCQKCLDGRQVGPEPT